MKKILADRHVPLAEAFFDYAYCRTGSHKKLHFLNESQMRIELFSVVKEIHLPGMLTYSKMTVNKQGCLGRGILDRPVSLLLFT